MTAELQGVDEVLAGFARAAEELVQRATQALEDEARALAADAAARAPSDSGELRESVYVEPKASGAGPGFEVGFRAPYAAFVHARPTLRSGEPQFLERAKDAAAAGMADRMAAKVRR